MEKDLSVSLLEDISQQQPRLSKRMGVSTSSSEFGDNESEFIGHKMG